MHTPGEMANLLVQSLIICSTQIWRGKASEISSHVVMSSRQRVDVQGLVCVWVQVNTSFVSNSTAKSYNDTFQVGGTKPTFTAEYSTLVF